MALDFHVKRTLTLIPSLGENDGCVNAVLLV